MITPPAEDRSEQEVLQALEDLYYAGIDSDSIEVVGGGNNKSHAIDRAKAAILADRHQSLRRLGEKIIGEDEPDGIDDGIIPYYRNELRAEQRAKLEEIISEI